MDVVGKHLPPFFSSAEGLRSHCFACSVTLNRKDNSNLHESSGGASPVVFPWFSLLVK